eukprot:UN18293
MLNITKLPKSRPRRGKKVNSLLNASYILSVPEQTDLTNLRKRQLEQKDAQRRQCRMSEYGRNMRKQLMEKMNKEMSGIPVVLYR